MKTRLTFFTPRHILILSLIPGALAILLAGCAQDDPAARAAPGVTPGQTAQPSNTRTSPKDAAVLQDSGPVTINPGYKGDVGSKSK